MKHKVKGRKLGRVRKQRIALFRMLAGSLILNGKVKTTEAKAKEIKPLIDKLFSKAIKAKKDENTKVAVIRDLKKHIPAKAVQKLINELVEKAGKRKSGFTRVTKLAPRKSDSAKMALIEFTD